MTIILHQIGEKEHALVHREPIFSYSLRERNNPDIVNDPSELFTVSGTRCLTKLLFMHRRKSKYRVFGGLWFGEEKPFFSTFFKPFVDTLQETEIRGKLQNI